jgi:hypothetical protein
MVRFAVQSADARTVGTENSVRGTFLWRKDGRSAATAKKANVPKNTVNAMPMESSAANHVTAMNVKTAEGIEKFFPY